MDFRKVIYGPNVCGNDEVAGGSKYGKPSLPYV